MLYIEVMLNIDVMLYIDAMLKIDLLFIDAMKIILILMYNQSS